MDKNCTEISIYQQRKHWLAGDGKRLGNNAKDIAANWASAGALAGIISNILPAENKFKWKYAAGIHFTAVIKFAPLALNLFRRNGP